MSLILLELQLNTPTQWKTKVYIPFLNSAIAATATYNGDATDQPVVSEMTARNNREFDLGTITVEYSYVEGE